MSRRTTISGRPRTVDGRTVSVSGAASGIGRATAVQLARHGCPVTLVDHDEAGLEETAQRRAGAGWG